MKDRLHAFLIHLAISSLIAAIAIFVVFYIWYPMPLHKAVGVTEIFLILLAVDITIGPVITFIIFNRNKPSLPFDLTVIAVLQLVALGYGMSTVYGGRPAFLVFNADRFDVSRSSDLVLESVKQAEAEGNESGKVGWLGPRWVGALRSSDIERNNEITLNSAIGGPDWPQLPELFVPLSAVNDRILQHAKPLSVLYDLYKEHNDKLSVLTHWKDTKEVKWLPLRSNAKDMIVLVNAESADIIKIIDITPWPTTE